MRQFRYVASLVVSLGLLINIETHGTGIMIPKRIDVHPLAIKSHRVKVKITDQVARTYVEEVFINNTNRQLEATFVFPLPAGASVSEFAMIVNGKRVVGEVLEKNRARQIYMDIVRRMKDPGLLEYLGSNLFKASVFPIPPRGEQKVEIAYSDVIKPDAGLAEFIYPLKTGEKASVTTSDFSMVVQLESRVPIKTVYSPTHKIDISRKSDHRVVVSFEEMRGALGRDFRLLYTLSEKDLGLHLVAHRTRGKPGYFLLMLAPRVDVSKKDILPKDVCFVIDTSGSMSGKKIQQAREALRYCIHNLAPGDRFNIVRFSTDTDRFKENLVQAKKNTLAEADAYVRGLEARGGTDINGALKQALSMKTSSKRPYLIVFLTDGKPTIGTTDPQAIVKNVIAGSNANIHIFVFGIGDQVNSKLLDQIASRTRATAQYVTTQEDIEVKVSSFFDKVSAPVLANLELDCPKAGIFDMYPKSLPDLFKGRQVLVFGRYRNPGHVPIRLSGTLQEKKKTFVFEATFPKEEKSNEFIAKLWANRKVGYLLDEIRSKGAVKELVDEVVALGKEYGIVTPYTSYLVTEDSEVVPPVDAIGSRTRGKGRRHAAAGEDRQVVDIAKGPPSASAPKRKSPGAPGAAEEKVVGDFDQGNATGPEQEGYLGKDTDKVLELAKRIRNEAEGLGRSFGRKAIQASKSLWDRKNKEVLPSSKAEELVVGKKIGAKTFRLVNGVWVDQSWKPENKPVRIKYLSDAYFKLLEAAPELKNLFALGENVLVVLKSGKAILTGEKGKETLSQADLKALFE